MLLEKKYIENQVSNNNLVKKFISEFKLKKKQIEKLYLCFRNDFYKQNDKNSEGKAVALINNFFPENDYKVYFVPYNPLSYLLLKELNRKNTIIIGFHVSIKLLFDLFKIFKRFFLTLLKKKIFIKNYKIGIQK